MYDPAIISEIPSLSARSQSRIARGEIAPKVW
jgi:hypothetical protein